MSHAELLGQLADERGHVLRSVDGLDEEALHRVVVPSGWTTTRLLNHLAFDNEMFWISAVLGADPRAIDALHDGWASVPMTGADAIHRYEREIARSNEVLASTDLDVPPRWTPPRGVYGGPSMRSGLEVVLRVLAETSVHAGHLDIVRELLDGRQNLVVGPAPARGPRAGPAARRTLRFRPDTGSRMMNPERKREHDATEAP